MISMDVPLKPLSVSRERYERIYRLIRDRICLLEYKPGARLAEEDLAREFGVSRTPIRRVLSRLENEGLLTSRHGVGTFVTDIDLGSLIQVYRLRMELAEMMGRLDPLPRTSADLDQVRALIARSDLLVKEPDGRAYARLNMDFFQELSSMIGNQPLKEITCRLYYQTTRIWLTMVPHLNLPEEIAIFRREMMDILEAMELGDFEAVGHIRRSHISMSVKRIMLFSKEGVSGGSE
jgi:DNA-binding GntR family transcriptional regulator